MCTATVTGCLTTWFHDVLPTMQLACDKLWVASALASYHPEPLSLTANPPPPPPNAPKPLNPAGPMDTSSVNDPSGRATGSSSYQEQQGADASQRSAHSMHVHHPGREAEVADLQNRSNSSSSGVQQGSAGPDAAAESASAAASSGGGGFDGVEGGPEAANILPRSERATTADFAAGGDDVSPPAEGSAPVNPDTGLPHMPDAASAGADCGRFGQLKQPGEVREQGMTARQTEKSTGMDPGGHGSS